MLTLGSLPIVKNKIVEGSGRVELSGVFVPTIGIHGDTLPLEFLVDRDSAMGSWRGICLVDLVCAEGWTGRFGFSGFGSVYIVWLCVCLCIVLCIWGCFS